MQYSAYFKNIDSKEGLILGTEEIVLSKIDYLSPVFKSVPIFLVCEDTIDKIFPPRRKAFDEECLIRAMEHTNSAKDYIGEIENFWRYASECISKLFVAVGVYVSNTNNLPYDIKNNKDMQGYKSVIFICPERVNSWADRFANKLNGLSGSYIKKVLGAKIIMHELAHGFMDNDFHDKKSKPWGHLIEESLANAVAFDLLATSSKRKLVLRTAMYEQPFEYKCFDFWINPVNRYNITLGEYREFCIFTDVGNIAEFWQDYDIIDVLNEIIYISNEYHYYHSRRHRIRWIYEHFLNGNIELFWQAIAYEIVKKNLRKNKGV